MFKSLVEAKIKECRWCDGEGKYLIGVFYKNKDDNKWIDYLYDLLVACNCDSGLNFEKDIITTGGVKEEVTKVEPKFPLLITRQDIEHKDGIKLFEFDWPEGKPHWWAYEIAKTKWWKEHRSKITQGLNSVTNKAQELLDFLSTQRVK